MYHKGIGFILIGIASTMADSQLLIIPVLIASLGALLTLIGGKADV